jgi:flavin-dependent dehydrogenase
MVALHEKLDKARDACYYSELCYKRLLRQRTVDMVHKAVRFANIAAKAAADVANDADAGECLVNEGIALANDAERWATKCIEELDMQRKFQRTKLSLFAPAGHSRLPAAVAEIGGLILGFAILFYFW